MCHQPAGRLRVRPFSKLASAKACNLSRIAIFDGLLISQAAGWRRIYTNFFGFFCCVFVGIGVILIADFTDFAE